MSMDVQNLIRRLIRIKQQRKEEEEDVSAAKLVLDGEGEGEVALKELMGGDGGTGIGSGAESGGKQGEEEGQVEKEKIGLHPEPGASKDLFWEQDQKEEEDVDISYPLIPNNPREDEKVYAWAEITYDETVDEVVYRVHEPPLSEKNERVLDKLEDRLKERINVDFGSMKRDEAKRFIEDHTKTILDRKEFSHLNQKDREVIQYYAYRNFVGLGRVEPLMSDKYVEDISCDGTGIPMYVYHRNPSVGSVQTTVEFTSDDELDSFVRKLAQRCGRSISMAEPLLDGSLPDGSRVQATLSTDIARRGSNFTIRRFTEEPLTPVDILEFGTVNEKILAYLWLCIENGKSMLVSGPTAAGKTSLLNALSLFIPPGLKIVSIEDTPELRLPHPNWVPEVARSGFGFGENKTGEVTLDDLLKESLRQRPDYIIVGEVRGEEAYILFQQIATGHPGMSTIHASSLEKVMDRLTTKPINLSPSLIENLDVIVFVKRVRRRGQYVRRVHAIYELEGFDKNTENPHVNKLFEWDANEDEFRNVSDSSVLADIMEDRGVSAWKLQSEIKRREKIIRWMQRNEITHYTEVGKIASQYHRHPDLILEEIGVEEE